MGNLSEPYAGLKKAGQWGSRFLDDVGDGTGNINMNKATFPEDFHYTVPAGNILLVEKLIIYIEDTGNFDVGGYGAVATPLALGLIDGITLPDDTFVHSGDIAVKKTADWASLCHELNYSTFGQGNNFLTLLYDFSADGAPIAIPPEHKFTVRCQDNLSFLVNHRIRVGGVLCKVN